MPSSLNPHLFWGEEKRGEGEREGEGGRKGGVISFFNRKHSLRCRRCTRNHRQNGVFRRAQTSNRLKEGKEEGKKGGKEKGKKKKKRKTKKKKKNKEKKKKKKNYTH